MQEHPETELAADYRLSRKSSFWAAFIGSGKHTARVYQLQVTTRNRGGAKTHAVLLETTPMRPLASVTVRGETYPLTIGWHDMLRGGILAFGGQRRTGLDGSSVEWEMRWIPVHEQPGSVQVEMRVRTSPRREGHVHLFLSTPLHSPEHWQMPPAASRQHSSQLAWSAYNQYGLGLVTLEGEPAVWDEAGNGFAIAWRGIPLGGGKLLRCSLRFLQSRSALLARSGLVRQYVAHAEPRLHPVSAPPSLDPCPVLRLLTSPEQHQTIGAERIYLKPPGDAPGQFYAGYPHYPADALHVLSEHNRFQPSDALSRLVRYGAHALAADFQVMGRQGESEPNKGAFWDRLTPEGFSDHGGGATHGIAANARLARAFFLLYESTKEPLLRQSALNICQWLILKQNARGYFDGERVLATRGLPDDGRFLPQSCALDGAEAIRPLTLAYQVTANEVFIKAAWKIADYLIQERMPEFDSLAAPEVASVLLGLSALDDEAPNARLRSALADWGAWLRALSLNPALGCLNADGLHSGLYECAQAGFKLYAQTRDPAYLRYGFAALAAVPEEARLRSWHTLEARTTALLSLACLLPDAVPHFDKLQITLGWRVFTPDPATHAFLSVSGAGGGPVDYLPLVCRLNDQLLIAAFAPPSVPALTIHKNSRRPLVRDLLTDSLDTDAPLHPVAGESWANVGLFTIDH